MPPGRPPHKPTDKDRRTVETMAAVGIPHDAMATVIGVAPKTLRKHYASELETASVKANTRVAQTLFNKAINGDTTAMIWWTKARMRWTDRQQVEHSGEVTVAKIERRIVKS